MTFHSRRKIMSGFRLDLAANFVGVGWSALVQIVCVPLYLRFLGIEAYGLIGFYLMMQAILQVLDFGLSPTMNREMARYSVQPEKAGEARDLVRTLEGGYWLIGIVIGALILAAAPMIAADWIKAGSIPVLDVQKAVMLMGVLAVFQWPVSFYQGGLLGLRRQVLYNGLSTTMVTLSNGGAVLILWLVSRTIQAFFLWLIAANAARAILLAIFLWKSLPPATRPPRFDLRLLQNIRRFAAGMSGITLIGLILTQVDKVFVSKLLPLKTFGYYSLAWAAASGLLIISGAVFNVIFPRLSAQVASGEEKSIRQSYHLGSQLMAVMVLPPAAVLSFFSFDILRAWSGSTEVAAFDALILGVLVVGSALNALLYLPYALQLAYGWTKLSFLAGLLSVAILIPVLFPMTKYFGAIGAASMWAVLNAVNMLVVVPIMHRRLLPHETWGYFKDIGLPIVATASVVALIRLVLPDLASPQATIVVLLGVWFCAFAVAVIAAPRIRSWTLAQLINIRLQCVKWVGSPS